MKLAGFSMQGKPKTEKKYYLIYARKSTESEDKQVNSIEDQLNAVEELKQKHNLEVLETFSESKSAKMPGRVEFNRMLNLIYQRQDIKGIVCWKLNRLSRNPQDEGALRWLLQSGVIEEIVTPQKTYKAEDSDFVMANEGAQAQRFITDLRQDIARGVLSKIEKGFAPIQAPPGYRNCREKKQGERDIEPHTIYFPLVQKLFRKALTGNYSTIQLYRLAIELGIQTNRGRLISRTDTYKILRNPFYCGKFIYGKGIHQGVHRPMITEEEYDNLQEILENRSRPRPSHNTDLLTGLIKCGECGMMITGEKHTKNYKNGTKQTFVYYRCTKKDKVVKCSQGFIPAKELERQVDDFLQSVRLSPKFVEWAIKWVNIANQAQKEIREAEYKSAKQGYETTIQKLDGLLDLKLSKLINDDEFIAKKEELTQEKSRLSQRLAKIDVHIDDWNTLASKTFDFVSIARERFANGTTEERKTILSVIGSNLILKDKKIEIEARKPFAYIQKVITELRGNSRLELNDKIDLAIQTDSSQAPNPLLYRLVNDVRTYYSNLQPRELEFYKTAFATL